MRRTRSGASAPRRVLIVATLAVVTLTALTVLEQNGATAKTRPRSRTRVAAPSSRGFFAPSAPKAPARRKAAKRSHTTKARKPAWKAAPRSSPTSEQQGRAAVESAATSMRDTASAMRARLSRTAGTQACPEIDTAAATVRSLYDGAKAFIISLGLEGPLEAALLAILRDTANQVLNLLGFFAELRDCPAPSGV